MMFWIIAHTGTMIQKKIYFAMQNALYLGYPYHTNFTYKSAIRSVMCDVSVESSEQEPMYRRKITFLSCEVSFVIDISTKFTTLMVQVCEV
jgi:hypothetical protein